MKDSQIQIKLAGAEYGFIIEPGPGGLGFSSDRLLAASSLDGKLLVASKAFLEISATPGQLVDYSASRFAPLSTDQLDTFAFADGHTELYCYIAGAFQLWDPSLNKFSNPEVASDPRLNRSLFQSSRLQLSLLNGQVVKKILIDQPASGQDWVEFNWVNTQFPFDVVKSLADQDGQLYVGTPAGLQVYSTLPLALDQMSALVGRRDPAGIGLVPVERVRIPVDSSKLLMARFSQECLERSGGAGFSGCASVAMLDRRLRVDTDYWQWVDSPTGLKGAYRADSGRLFGGGITARQDDGRLYGGIDESHA